MAITVYRSRFADHGTEGERVEMLMRSDPPRAAKANRGADAKFSDDIKGTLLSALRDGTLDMFRAAYAMATLIERHGMTQSELAAELGQSQSAVANKLRLLRFSEWERERILRAGLSERHARALLRLRDEGERREALETVIGQRMSVSRTEELILSLSPDGEVRPRRGKGAISDLRFFCNSIDRAVDLARRAGVRIELDRRESDGIIEMQIRVLKSENQSIPS